MSEIKYGNFKIGFITCKRTSKRPEKMLQNEFSYEFSLCIRSRKNDSVNGMPEKVAPRTVLTKMTDSVFHGL